MRRLLVSATFLLTALSPCLDALCKSEDILIYACLCDDQCCLHLRLHLAGLWIKSVRPYARGNRQVHSIPGAWCAFREAVRIRPNPGFRQVRAGLRPCSSRLLSMVESLVADLLDLSQHVGIDLQSAIDLSRRFFNRLEWRTLVNDRTYELFINFIVVFRYLIYFRTPTVTRSRTCLRLTFDRYPTRPHTNTQVFDPVFNRLRLMEFGLLWTCLQT